MNKTIHRKNRNISMALAAMLLAWPAQAAEQLPEMVITADRIGQNEASVSADVTVIDQQQIEKSQAATVVELLRSQAGVDVAASGGPGKATSVFLRGGNSGHTLVLIDGVRVGSATLGSFDWGNLSAADIERIEIVRGPQSSLYGADAMGGVIQIFTRRGKQGTQVRVSSEAGSYGTSSGTMSVTGQTESDVSYALSVNGLRTGGISAAAKGTELDPYRQFTVSGRVGLPVGDGELELIARNVDGKNGLDGGFPFGDVVNFISNTKQSVGSAKLTYPLSDWLESSLQLSRSLDEVIGHDPAGGFNNSDFRTRIDQLTWQNHIDLDAVSLLAGLDMYRSKGVSGSAKLNRKINQTAGFAVMSWGGDWIDVNASLRYDANSTSSNQTTYKFGTALHPLDGVKITANYGTGFKAPSINDLFFPFFGNPNLQAEKSKGWDAGVHYQYKSDDLNAAFDVVWFDQRYTNLIIFQTAPTVFLAAPTNLAKARTKGLELSASLAYGSSYIHANWTYLNAKDTATGSLLARRAKDSGNVTVGATLAGLNAEVTWHVVGPRFSSAFNQKPMQGYQKTDIRASYAINKQWKLTARVDNVGNKSYEEVSGFGVLGRAWYGGVSSRF
ncbi:TonB-dependent receptor [Mariprofundus ferrooxydans]|nr:TonB-dependent receptor [Mariprofundus ferrooxydans]